MTILESKDFFRIYLVGAHSTGKSTLCRWISNKYRIPMITEIARQVLTEMEKDLDEIRSNIDLLNEYQKRIFLRQFKTEQLIDKTTVIDRSIDCLIYNGLYGTNLNTLTKTKDYESFIKMLQEKNSLIFFIRPDKEMIREQSVRASMDMIWENIVEFDGALKLFLEISGIEYMPVKSNLQQERRKIISYVLDAHIV